MRLAVISGIDKPTTLTSKGGTEVWTATFVSEEAKKGHSIDLYASAGSLTTSGITLIPTLDKELTEYYADPYFTSNPTEFTKRKEQFMATVYAKVLLAIKKKEQEYDVLIDSCSYPSITANLSAFSIPTLSIQHFPVGFSSEYYERVFPESEKHLTVYPSSFQYDQAMFIPDKRKAVIPHGVDTSTLLFDPDGGEAMLWMGRIHERTNKGIVEAIRTANETEKNLVIHATVEKSSETYFKQKVEPLFTPLISYNPPFPGKDAVFGEAKVFLFPIMWEEPFGLVFLEAMACGTPVIAFARGAVPEIIKDGVTGFIINPSEDDIRGEFVIKATGMEGLSEAVRKLYAMSDEEYKKMREACRAHVEKNFTVTQMIDHYESLYQKMLPSK